MKPLENIKDYYSKPKAESKPTRDYGMIPVSKAKNYNKLLERLGSKGKVAKALNIGANNFYGERINKRIDFTCKLYLENQDMKKQIADLKSNMSNQVATIVGEEKHIEAIKSWCADQQGVEFLK